MKKLQIVGIVAPGGQRRGCDQNRRQEVKLPGGVVSKWVAGEQVDR